MKAPWYAIRAASRGSDTAHVDVIDTIGAEGLSAKQFIADFDVRAARASKVALGINSPGGSAADAIAMFDHLRASGKQIVVTVLGIAAGEASFLAMAGDRVRMPANTMALIRYPISGTSGNAAHIRNTATALDGVAATFTAAYAKRWRGDRKSLQAMLAAEPFLTASECQKLGLADEVIPEIVATARFATSKLPVKAQRVFAPAGGHSPQSLWEEIHAMRKTR